MNRQKLQLQGYAALLADHCWLSDQVASLTQELAALQTTVAELIRSNQYLRDQTRRLARLAARRRNRIDQLRTQLAATRPSVGGDQVDDVERQLAGVDCLLDSYQRAFIHSSGYEEADSED